MKYSYSFKVAGETHNVYRTKNEALEALYLHVNAEQYRQYQWGLKGSKECAAHAVTLSKILCLLASVLPDVKKQKGNYRHVYQIDKYEVTRNCI